MPLVLPEPDYVVMRQRDAIVKDLRRLVGPGAIIACTGTGVGICTVPRCWGVLEMRIFIPFSVEISTESKDVPSSISISFFT